MEKQISFRQAVLMMQHTSRDFYVEMGDRAADRKVTEIYYFLASEEVKRMEALEKLADLPTSTDALNKAFEEAGEMMLCMMPGAAEGEVCPVPLKSASEALEFAIKQKKESILFFHTLLRYSEEEALVDQIQSVMEIEYDLIKNLSTLLALVRKEEGRQAAASGNRRTSVAGGSDVQGSDSRAGDPLQERSG